MFGFIVGVIATVGFWAWRRGMIPVHVGWEGGWGGSRGRGGHGRGGFGRGGFGRGGGRPWMLSALFRRLDTSPDQERTLSEAFEAVREVGRQHREKLGTWREEFARVMASDALDDARVQALLDQHDAALGDLKRATREALGRVHGVLDPEQRAELAELVANGWGGYGRHGWSRC